MARPPLTRIGFYGCAGRIVKVGPIEVDHILQAPKSMVVQCPCGFQHLVCPGLWRKPREGERCDVAVPTRPLGVE